MVSVSSIIPRRSVLPCIKLRLKQHLQVRATGLQKTLSCDLSGHFDFSKIAGRSHKLLSGDVAFYRKRSQQIAPSIGKVHGFVMLFITNVKSLRVYYFAFLRTSPQPFYL